MAKKTYSKPVGRLPTGKEEAPNNDRGIITATNLKINARANATDEIIREMKMKVFGEKRPEGDILMPTFKKTKHTLYVDSWNDDDYVYRNNMYVTLSALLTDSCRQWNATPSSMQKLDGRVLEAMDAYSDHSLIKDWVDAQRSGAVRLLIGWADFLIQMGLQLITRRLCPAYAENDASEFWSEDTWVSFLLGLQSRQLKIPVWSVNFARCFLIYWANSPPYGEIGLPISYYIPFAPRYTYAQACALRDDMMAYQHGILHFEKAKIPYMPFDTAMIEPVQVEYDSEIAEFIKIRSTGYFRNDAGATTTMYQEGNMCQNDTTEFTDAYCLMHNRGRPDNIWAMAPLFTRYEATYNPYACTGASSALTVNNKFGFGQIAFMGTGFSAYIGASDFALKVMPSFWPGLTLSTFSSGGTNAQLSAVIGSRMLHDSVFYAKGLSRSQWFQINTAALQYLFAKPIV